MEMQYKDIYKPVLTHICQCGSEMRSSAKTYDLICDSCHTTISAEDRRDIEGASRTILKTALEEGIQAVKLNNVSYDIEEAVMPSGILPHFIDRVVESSLLLEPEREFHFQVVEYNSPRAFKANSHLLVEVNPNSEMTYSEALPIINDTVKCYIKISRADHPETPYIIDLRILPRAVLAPELGVAS